MDYSDEQISALELNQYLMSSEDEGLSHPPSYQLDSFTKFPPKTFDPIIVLSKRIVSFVRTKSVKTPPSCL